MRKSVLLAIAIFCQIPLRLRAQGNLPLVPLPLTDLFQYQVTKDRHPVDSRLFSKYGLRRIRPQLVVEADDSRSLWGWHIRPNPGFDKATQPLYRLFSKADNSSLAVIDDRAGQLQLVFWDKAYYLSFVKDMRQHGYSLQPAKPSANILRFRRKDTSIVIDVTVWADMYVIDLYSTTSVEAK